MAGVGVLDTVGVIIKVVMMTVIVVAMMISTLANAFRSTGRGTTEVSRTCASVTAQR